VETAVSVEALGRRCICVSCDVNEAADIETTIESTRAAFGSFQILVNNAGVASLGAPEETTDEEWSAVIDTNLTSVFRFSRSAYPTLAEAGGKIINIGSMLSIFGLAFAPAYAASKGGIVQLTKALATAWAKDNIQVNAVLPGWIDTELTRQARAQIDGLHERVEARTPAGHWGHPDDHAGIAVFLAARASDFVTGTAIPVDGGYSVQG